MNRLPFRKQYAKLQQSSKGILREFYEEAIYFLHQPGSLNFRFFVLFGSTYLFAGQILNYQMYFSTVYKRKRMRLLELYNNNLPPQSREEHENMVENHRNFY